MFSWDLENTRHLGAFSSLFSESLDQAPPILQTPVLHLLLLGKSIKQLFFDLTKAAASNNLLKCRTSQGEGRKFPSDREGYQKEKDFDIIYSLCSGLEMVWLGVIGRKQHQLLQRGSCHAIRENLKTRTTKFMNVWLRLEAPSNLFASSFRYKISVQHVNVTDNAISWVPNQISWLNEKG